MREVQELGKQGLEVLASVLILLEQPIIGVPSVGMVVLESVPEFGTALLWPAVYV